MLSNQIQNRIEMANLIWSRLPNSEEIDGNVVEASCSRAEGGTVESLDYETIENFVYREEQTKRGNLNTAYIVMVKWFFSLLSDIGNGLAAVFIILAMENFAGWKFAVTFSIIHYSYIASFIGYIFINLALVFFLYLSSHSLRQLQRALVLKLRGSWMGLIHMGSFFSERWWERYLEVLVQSEVGFPWAKMALLSTLVLVLLRL